MNAYKRNLPAEERWDFIVEAVEASNGKLGKIDVASWHNKLTGIKEEVYEIPVLAYNNNSDRPLAVTHIIVQNLNLQSNTQHFYDIEDESTWFEGLEVYTFNQKYFHVNISAGTGVYTYNYKEETEDGGQTEYIVKFYGQEICSPVTRYSFFSKPMEDVLLIMKGQLMGQNSGSAYQSVQSIHNAEIDLAIFPSSFSTKAFKKSDPILALLSKRTISELKERANFTSAIQKVKELSVNEEQVCAKYKRETEYVVFYKDVYEQEKEKGLISDYYPVITYEMIEQIINIQLPKEQFDVVCAGLGSAGSGILDIIGRYNYTNSFLLLDPDHVEEKNLRNQWYNYMQIGRAKAPASSDLLKSLSMNNNVLWASSRFQNASAKFFKDYKFKYAISGFDTIDTRLQFLEYIEKGIIETQYLIDARYEKLTSALYFIDLSNEEQVKLYRDNLEEDKRLFDLNKEYIETGEEFYEWFNNKDYTHTGCYATLHKYFHIEDDICDPRQHGSISCGSPDCINYLKELFEKNKENVKIEREKENSCIMQNFIDIYKYSSSIIATALKEIEEGNEKPWTYVEATTDVIPGCMIIRK